jgi:membrane protein
MNNTTGPGAGTVERARAGLTELLQTLRAWPWFETLRTLRQRFREDRLGQTAGSLTFTTLIALVPLVTVVLAVFSAFPMFAGFEAALQKYFLNNLVPEGIAKPVLRALTQFAGKARSLGTLGLLLLLATALALVLTIDRTLNGIWRVRQPRPLGQRVLVYWAALTLGPLALGASLTITSLVVSASRGLVDALPGGVALVLDAVQFGLLLAATAGLYHYVPHTDVRWRHALAGGLFVAVAFELAKAVLAWYVDSVPVYSTVYGALATLPILLLWIYTVWVIVLLGAIIAAYAPSLQMRVVRRPPHPGWRFELALEVLKALRDAREGDLRGVSLADLATALRTDPLQLEPLVDLLVALDWVARLDEAGAATDGPRLLLLCDPARTSLKPLLDHTLLAPGPAAAAFSRRAALDRLTLQDVLSG